MKKIALIVLFVFTLTSCSYDKVEIMQIEDDFSNVDVEIVFENDKENGINIIFMGDGYLKSDLDRESGVYRREAIESINTVFNTKPFSEYKEHFNAYIVYVESEEDVISFETISNTAFGSTAEICSSGLSCLVISYYSLVDYYVRAAKGRNRKSNDIVLMSVNNTGGGSAKVGSRTAVFGRANYNIMIHEIGHVFGGLGDEYIVRGYTTPFTPTTDNRANLDQTGNIGKVKWKHFIGLDDYENVGTFEGGAYVNQGVWRPEKFSVMQSASTTHFNAPSRESIVKRILGLRGMPYSFEDFLEIDRANMNRTNLSDFKNRDLKPLECGIVLEN